MIRVFVKKLFWCLVFIMILNVAWCDLAGNYLKKATETKDIDEKITNYSIALKLNESLKEALVGRAEAYYEKGNVGQAVKDLDRFEEKFPATPAVLVLRGKIAEREGLLEKAGSYYDTALTIDKNLDEANFRKGLYLVSLGKLKKNPKLFKEAISYFAEVKAKSDFFTFSQSQAVRCMEFHERFEDAEKVYETLRRHNPQRSFFAFNLARLQYMNEKYEESYQTIHEACDLTFSDNSNNFFYGAFRYYLAKRLMEDLTAADFEYKKFSSKMKDSEVKSLFLTDLGEKAFIEKALAGSEKLSKKRIKSLTCEAYCFLGYFYLIKDKKDDASRCFAISEEHGQFGMNHYYLSKFEHQKLKVSQEVLERKN